MPQILEDKKINNHPHQVTSWYDTTVLPIIWSPLGPIAMTVPGDEFVGSRVLFVALAFRLFVHFNNLARGFKPSAHTHFVLDTKNINKYYTQ